MKSIKKKDLVEIRSMGNPPPAVKLALEAVCLLMGETVTDWKGMRSVIIKDSFIGNIVTLQTEDVRFVFRFIKSIVKLISLWLESLSQ